MQASHQIPPWLSRDSGKSPSAGLSSVTEFGFSLRASWIFFATAYFGLIIGLGTWYFIRNEGYALDDSFITYRYAFHLREGYGLVFNVGESYYGTTAAGYAVLLAVGAALASALAWLVGVRLDALHAIPLVATFASAFAMVSIAAILPVIARARTNWAQWILSAAASILLFSSGAFNEVAGHETYPFLAAAFIGTVLIVCCNAYLAGSLCLAIATSFRPDAILFAAIVPAMDWLRCGLSLRRYLQRPQVAASILLYCSVLGLWLGYLAWHFGTPLPGTMAAKRAQVILGDWTNYSPSILIKFLKDRTDPTQWHLACVGWLAFFLAAVGFGSNKPGLAKFLSKRKLEADVCIGAVWLIFGILSVGAYLAFRVTFWAWYGTPPEFVLFVVAFVGWIKLHQWARELVPQRIAARAAWLKLISPAVPVAILILLTAKERYYFITWEQTRHVWAHSSAYLEIADFVRKERPGGASIQTLEPGSLGYHLGPKYVVVDELGLTAPGVAQALMRHDFSWTFNKWHPDYVICSWPAQFAACTQGLQKASYELVGEFDRDFWTANIGHGAQLWRKAAAKAYPMRMQKVNLAGSAVVTSETGRSSIRIEQTQPDSLHIFYDGLPTDNRWIAIMLPVDLSAVVRERFVSMTAKMETRLASDTQGCLGIYNGTKDECSPNVPMRGDANLRVDTTTSQHGPLQFKFNIFPMRNAGPFEIILSDIQVNQSPQ